MLREVREKEKKEKDDERVRFENAMKSEARSPHHLFEKEFIPNKGMKNAGYGGLIVGKHY